MHFPSKLIAAILVAIAASSASAAEVTATHALVKIRPGDAPPPDQSAWIGAAANEMESFQVVVSGGAQGATGVSAHVSDLHGSRGTVPAKEIVLYREEYMNISQRSDGNSLSTGRVPDALIPDVDPIVGEKRNAFPFDVPKNENRVIWVDVHVPQGTRAGTYKGTVTVDGSGFHTDLPVELEVYPFELPSTPSYATAYGLSWSGPCLGHGKAADCGSEDAANALRSRYAIAALDDRISLSGIAAFPPPVKGGATDFTGYDAAYGRLLDGSAGTRLPGASLTAVQLYAHNPQASDFKDWARHFKDKGWFDKLFDYTCDEPPNGCSWDSIKTRENAAHSGDPALRTLVTTTTQHAKDHGFYDTTDIFVPVVNFVEGKKGDSYAGDQSGAYRTAESQGHIAWMYTSCMSHGCGNTVNGEYAGEPDLAGWPSAMIDHPAIRNRALPWVAFGRGFTGELYFQTDYAFGKRDPWQSQWDFTGNGDGTYFYPGTPAKIGGKTDIPIESMRLKLLRDGIEDYEYLKVLEQKSGPGAAQKAAMALMPHAWSAGDVKPEKMLEARRILAAAIGHTGPVSGWRPGAASQGYGSAVSGLSLGSGAPGGGCASGGGKAGLIGLAFAGLGLVVMRLRRR